MGSVWAIERSPLLPCRQRSCTPARHRKTTEVESYRVHDPQPTPNDPQHSIERTAADVGRRLEEELAGLAAVERQLDHLDRQLSELRARLVHERPQLD